MADEYTTGPQREITRIDPLTGQIVEAMEIPVRDYQSGSSFTVKVPLGPDFVERAQVQIAERLAEVRALHVPPASG